MTAIIQIAVSLVIGVATFVLADHVSAGILNWPVLIGWTGATINYATFKAIEAARQ